MIVFFLRLYYFNENNKCYYSVICAYQWTENSAHCGPINFLKLFLLTCCKSYNFTENQLYYDFMVLLKSHNSNFITYIFISTSVLFEISK